MRFKDCDIFGRKAADFYSLLAWIPDLVSPQMSEMMKVPPRRIFMVFHLCEFEGKQKKDPLKRLSYVRNSRNEAPPGPAVPEDLPRPVIQSYISQNIEFCVSVTYVAHILQTACPSVGNDSIATCFHDIISLKSKRQSPHEFRFFLSRGIRLNWPRLEF